jgi:hypothetical protein
MVKNRWMDGSLICKTDFFNTGCSMEKDHHSSSLSPPLPLEEIEEMGQLCKTGCVANNQLVLYNLDDFKDPRQQHQ